MDRLTIILSNFSSFGMLMGTLGPQSEVLPAVLNKNQAETNIVSSTAWIAFCFASEYRVPNCRRVCQYVKKRELHSTLLITFTEVVLVEAYNCFPGLWKAVTS